MILKGSSNFRKVSATNFSDQISWRGNSNTIDLFGGNDNLYLNGNSNIAMGGEGYDQLFLSGSGNTISGFSWITVYRGSYGNHFYGNNFTVNCAADTSLYAEGNGNVIKANGVTNVEMKGNGNTYSYFRNASTKNKNLNHGITVTGNHNKIVNGTRDRVDAVYSVTSSLTITGNGNDIEAKRAEVHLTSLSAEKNTIRGNYVSVNYDYKAVAAESGVDLLLDGQYFNVNLHRIQESPSGNDTILWPTLYLDGVMNVQKSLTINLDEETDAFRLSLENDQKNKALNKISIFSRYDLSVSLGGSSVFFERGDLFRAMIDGLGGNDDVYLNGRLIYNGK